MKKEYVCYNCDMHFTVSFKGNDPVEFCPFCGQTLDNDDSNVFEDDE